MGKIRSKSNSKKKDITLMTILANEATAGSRNLLKKYGKGDASDHDDLEEKLAQLYYETPDKITLEREMAEIHPHKAWLQKYMAPPIMPKVQEEKKEEIKIEPIAEKKVEVCSCPSCLNSTKSSFDGTGAAQPRIDTRNHTLDYIGIIGTVAVVGALFFVLSKAHK